jgi:hypothetical protein
MVETHTMTMEQTLKLLLVEDDEDHAHLVIRAMRKSGVLTDVTHVLDGAAALDYLRRQSDDPNGLLPDLIILEVLRQVKEQPMLRSIPVIMLTTSGADVDRQRAYELHVNSYVMKPMDAAGFRELVSQLYEYWIGVNVSFAD